MLYDQRIIDQVQGANDIVEIIGQYLALKRSGRNLKANCPFHQEKTPSFMVQPEKQIFHCFGCGVGGDVFGFVMRYENMNFPETIRQLAERANIVLPRESAKKSEGPTESEQLYEIYQLARDFYHQQYMDPVKGKVARDYFEKRGFKPEMAAELKMGWASDGWNNLLDFLRKKGCSEDLLMKSGLIFRSSKGTLYDAFRARLIFPIQNLQSKVVAFGGRILGEGTPKYLNSPENPIFHKRRELFGLNFAKKYIDRERPQIIVVEGYFGFLRLYQEDFKAVVATLGTSLTDEHVQVLKRFAEEAIVVYDGDKAGEAASLRGLEVFLEGGMNVKIARLPTGLDPDDFLKKENREAFQKILASARDFFDYKLEILFGRYNRSDSLGLMRITGDFLETFLKIQNPVLLDRYLKKLASSLGVEENSLRSELMKMKKKTGGGASKEEKNISVPKHSPDIVDEMWLLSIAAEDSRFRQILFQELQGDDFREPGSRPFFEMLKETDDLQQKQALPQRLSRLTDEKFKQKLIAAMAFEWSDAEREKAFQDCLKRVKSKRLTKRLEELRRSIAKAEQSGDAELVRQFAREYQDLWRQGGLKEEVGEVNSQEISEFTTGASDGITPIE